MWDEIIYPFTKFKSKAVKVRELVSNFITPFAGYTISFAGFKFSYKMGPMDKMVEVFAVFVHTKNKFTRFARFL